MPVKTRVFIAVVSVAFVVMLGLLAVARDGRVPESTRNLLADAKNTGNLVSFNKGLRGQSNHVVYDIQQRSFLEA